MIELDKYFAVGMSHKRRSLQQVLVLHNIFRFAKRFRDLDVNYVSKCLALDYDILLHGLDFIFIKEVLNRDHIQKLDYTARGCAVERHLHDLFIWNILVHGNERVLTALSSFLYFESLVDDLQIVQRLDRFVGSSLIFVLKEGVTFVQIWVLHVFDQVELLQSAKRGTNLLYFGLGHRERDAAHVDSIVNFLLVPFFVAILSSFLNDFTVSSRNNFLLLLLASFGPASLRHLEDGLVSSTEIVASVLACVSLDSSLGRVSALIDLFVPPVHEPFHSHDPHGVI